MKYVFAFLLSGTVLACPTINGNFTCKKGSNVFNLNFLTNGQSYIIQHDGIESEYVVDGKIYEIPATDSYKDAKVSSTCDGNSLVVGFEANILYEGSVIAHQVSKSIYSMDNENLIFTQKTKMKGVPLPSSKFVCTPN